MAPYATSGGNTGSGSALKSMLAQGQSLIVMTCSSQQRKNSSSNVIIGTSPPPSLFIKSTHLPIHVSLGLLMAEITLGRSPGSLSKKKVQGIVPYPKLLVLLFLMEVRFSFLFFFRLVRRAMLEVMLPCHAPLSS